MGSPIPPRMTAQAFEPPRAAEIVLDGWSGIVRQPVEVIGETPKRYRVRAIQRTRLAGRNRWIDAGEVVLVPRRAVQFLDRSSAQSPPTQHDAG